MKTILLASAAFLASTAVHAADFVYEAPAAPMVEAPVIFTWSGPYVGIQGGGTWGTLTGDIGATNSKHSIDGGLLGGFIGYQHQFPSNLVLGIEGDLDYNWNEKKSTIAGVDIKAGTELAGSVRARIGYGTDRTLIYATGGWATTRGYGEATSGGVTVKEKETFNGWTVGAGVEHAFTDNLFGRAEYRYNDYGDKDYGAGKLDLDQHSVKIGLGVKF